MGLSRVFLIFMGFFICFIRKWGKVTKVWGCWVLFSFWCVDYIFCKPPCIFFVLLSRQKYQKYVVRCGGFFLFHGLLIIFSAKLYVTSSYFCPDKSTKNVCSMSASGSAPPRFSRSADSRRGYFYCPPQCSFCVTLTTTTHLGCRVQPTFDDRTSRFDIFLESHSYNNTIDAFCPVEFILLVLRGLVSHK